MALDFFEAQESARSRSRLLVLLFVVAVLAIIVTIYAVVHFTFGPGTTAVFDWRLFLTVAVGISLVVGAGSGVRTLQLRQGGPRVAEMLGGRRVRMDTSDPSERMLVNVVEEMAIASGTPVPAIFILDGEQGINAFAAGYTLDDAAVAVTRGTLQHLNRDELQGVIAHEFSHILNGDMRLNIRLIGLLFGILLLAIAGRFLLQSGARGGRSRRDNGGGQIALLGVALLVVGYIGVFFGRLIQSAVSRQREYLADAAAVQFTRNPDGLAGALKKIGGYAGSRMTNHHAQEASHLFFASGLRSSMFSVLATHPPLNERIRRLDPSFDGTFPIANREAAAEHILQETSPGVLAGMSNLTSMLESGVRRPGMPSYHETPPPPRAPIAPAVPARDVTGAELIATIGAPQREHVDHAAHFLETLPASLYDAAHDPDGAVALLFALLTHSDDRPAVEARQNEILDIAGGASLRDRVRQLEPQVSELGDAARLPLLDLLLPSVRELSPDQAQAIVSTAESLVEADGRLDAFELALLHVLERQLEAARAGRNHSDSSGSIRKVEQVRDEIATIVSAVTWRGADDYRAALLAFDAARSPLPREVSGIGLRKREDASLRDVQSALERVRKASLPIRRVVLEACAAAVTHDGRVEVQEATLLRAVAEALDCPMPLLQGLGNRD
jgi:Zn-dependent protease with chaperone function